MYFNYVLFLTTISLFTYSTIKMRKIKESLNVYQTTFADIFISENEIYNHPSAFNFILDNIQKIMKESSKGNKFNIILEKGILYQERFFSENCNSFDDLKNTFEFKMKNFSCFNQNKIELRSFNNNSNEIFTHRKHGNLQNG